MSFFKSKKGGNLKLTYTLETEKLGHFTKQLPQTNFPLPNAQEFKYLPFLLPPIQRFTLNPSEKKAKSIAFIELPGTQ